MAEEGMEGQLGAALRREDTARQKTSVSLDPYVLKELQKAGIDRDMSQSEAIEEAIRMWLAGVSGQSVEGKQEGETVSYPASLKDVIDLLLRLYHGRPEGPEHGAVQYLIQRIVDRMLQER